MLYEVITEFQELRANLAALHVFSVLRLVAGLPQFSAIASFLPHAGRPSFHRITSYNVCYTKLLRIMKQPL